MNNLTDHDLAQTIWDYMRYEHALERADVILGMGCNDMRVADHCAKLYHEGYAPRILFSGSRGELTRGLYQGNEAELYFTRACELGVPKDVIIVESRAENSGENMRFAALKLQELDIGHSRMIIVHKPYMLRRMYATFMKQWPESPKPFVITSAIQLTMDEYVHNSYTTIDYMINIMVGDLQRIKEYPARGFQIAQEIPDEVQYAYDELVRRGYVKHLLNAV